MISILEIVAERVELSNAFCDLEIHIDYNVNQSGPVQCSARKYQKFQLQCFHHQKSMRQLQYLPWPITKKPPIPPHPHRTHTHSAPGQSPHLFHHSLVLFTRTFTLSSHFNASAKHHPPEGLFHGALPLPPSSTSLAKTHSSCCGYLKTSIL